MLRDEPVVIFGDGEQTRDFVHVGDVVEAYQLVQNLMGSATVNVGSATPTTVNEVFRVSASEIGYSKVPLYEAERDGDVRHLVLNNERAKSLLGWFPKTSFQVGLHNTVDWIRSQS